MENIEPTPNPSSEGGGNFTDEVKSFYTGKFPALLSKFFKDPLNGLKDIFEKSTDQGLTNSLILYGSVFAFYLLGLIIVLGKLTEITGYGIVFKLAFVAVFFMFMISVVSFGIKSISGTPNFKSELLTGALTGIPLTILMLYLILAKIFGDASVATSALSGSFGGGGLIMSAVTLYVLLMMLNVIQQSLLAAGTNKTLAWYLTPASLIIAYFVTSKIANALFS